MKRTPVLILIALFAVVVVFATGALTPRLAFSQTRPQVPPIATVTLTSSPTNVLIYVLARGGKFIGDDVGDAEIAVRDARTGELLASGLTQGGSGAADLMTVQKARTTPISIEGAAVFTATLNIDEPRLVEVEAFAPLAGQASANHVTTTEWVVPQDIANEQNRIILEIPGLNVAVLNPPTHFLPTTKPPLDIPLRVNVTMMCGCPISPTTAWHPEDFSVKAMVKKPDGTSELVDLQFDANAPDHAPSQFIGTYTAAQSGVYEAIVFAHQAGTDNNGSDRVTFILP